MEEVRVIGTYCGLCINKNEKIDNLETAIEALQLEGSRLLECCKLRDAEIAELTTAVEAGQRQHASDLDRAIINLDERDARINALQTEGTRLLELCRERGDLLILANARIADLETALSGKTMFDAAEAEREACAKVAETWYSGTYVWGDLRLASTSIAAAIRARGAK